MRDAKSVLRAGGLIVFAGLGVFVAATLGPIPSGGGENDPPTATLESDDLLVEPGEAAAEIGELSQETTPSQAPALADGRATATEYLAGVRRSQVCTTTDATEAAREHGVVVDLTFEDPHFTIDEFLVEGGYSIDIVRGDVADLPADALDQLSHMEQSCQRTHYRDIERAYHLSLRSDPGYLREVADGLESCLSEGGYETDLTPQNALAVLGELAAAEDAATSAPAPAADSVTADTAIDEGRGAEMDGDHAPPESTALDCAADFPSVTVVLDAPTID